MLSVKFSAFISFLHRQMLATVIVLYILKLGGIVNFPGYSLSILYKVRVNSELTQQGGRRKNDGKPCVTSVTISLFEKTFGQTSLSFNKIFL